LGKIAVDATPPMVTAEAINITIVIFYPIQS
jgi:hypothetical protein